MYLSNNETQVVMNINTIYDGTLEKTSSFIDHNQSFMIYQNVRTETVYNDNKTSSIQKYILELKPVMKIFNNLPLPLEYKIESVCNNISILFFMSTMA